MNSDELANLFLKDRAPDSNLRSIHEIKEELRLKKEKRQQEVTEKKKQNNAKAQKAYVERILKEGRSAVTVYLDSDLVRFLHHIRIDNDTTLSKVVEDIVKEYKERTEKEV